MDIEISFMDIYKCIFSFIENNNIFFNIHKSVVDIEKSFFNIKNVLLFFFYGY